MHLQIIYGLSTNHKVKMQDGWIVHVAKCLCINTESGSINTQKNEANI